jgi:FkbM family methyltransferase
MIKDLIYDVGLHEGQDTAYYLRKGFRVVAVEANPELVKAAERRFTQALASKRLVIVGAAIAGRDGEGDFWVCDSETAWSSSHRDIASRRGAPHHKVTVPQVRFGRLLAETGTPFYLKIDIEESDALCLEDLSRGDLPAYLSFELTHVELIERAVALGYRDFKLVDQFSHCAITFPPTPEYRAYRVRQRILRSRRLPLRVFRKLGGRSLLIALDKRSRSRSGWYFAFGSSGPFGEDAPGPWLSSEQVRLSYLRHEAMCSAPSDLEDGVWCDIHARSVP